MASRSRRPGFIYSSALFCCNKLRRLYHQLQFLYGGPRSPLERVKRNDSKVGTQDQQHQHHLTVCSKCKFSGPRPKSEAVGGGAQHVRSDRNQVICMHVEVRESWLGKADCVCYLHLHQCVTVSRGHVVRWPRTSK